MAALGARLGQAELSRVPVTGPSRSQLALRRASHSRAGCVTRRWAGHLGVTPQGSARTRSKTGGSGGKWTFIKGVVLLGRWVPGSGALDGVEVAGEEGPRAAQADEASVRSRSRVWQERSASPSEDQGADEGGWLLICTYGNAFLRCGQMELARTSES